MVGRGHLGLGFEGALVVFIVVPVLFFVFRWRWRVGEGKKEEVRRLALLAAAEEQRVEMEAMMEYLAVSAVKREAKGAVKEALRSSSGMKEALCAFCFVSATARCSKCKAVKYCSAKCQIAHWREGHKDECFPPSDNYKSTGQSIISSLLGKQVAKIVIVNGELEVEAQPCAQVVQIFPEPCAASLITSTSDTLDEDNMLEKKTDNNSGTIRASSAVDSSKQKFSGAFSTVNQHDSSLSVESILDDAASPGISVPANSALDGSDISGPESFVKCSAVKEVSYSTHLHQNESISTVETVEGLLSENQPSITSEHEFVDLSGGKHQSTVVGSSSGSGLGNQIPCNLPTTEKRKSQSERENIKASSNQKVNSPVVSTTNNVEMEKPGSKTHSSSADQLSSYSGDDSIAVSRTSRMDNASPNPKKSADDKGFMQDGMTQTLEKIVNHLKIPRPSQVDSANTGPRKSLDDKCPIPSGVAASVNRVNQLAEPKISKHYQSELMLFPYDQFIKLYNYNIIELCPSGLTNCGNSCYANAVLQCLAFTRPLTAYFLEGFHSIKCRKREWCFTCEFGNLIANVKKRKSPISPSVILSHLDDIGGNFGHGRQEDAHEFLRFVVDAMQSVCLNEAGVKAGNQLADETTLIQQTFGGYLQSKIKCSRCKGKSDRCERMMDLTVEINGDVNTLEEALKCFTSVEILDGANKYECPRCKSYQRAKKRLTILEAPNILVIALKRFQSGKFGKLNKTVQFPEYLDLAPYMSATDDKSPVYGLYAVIVHIDVLNSSQSGHYVCYVKDTGGRWYNVDDSKVRQVELENVLSEGAYMLLYARYSPRAPTFVRKAMSYQSVKLKRSKSNFWDKSGPLLRHLSVPASTLDSFNFQSTDLFDDRIQPFVQGYSSDNSLFSNSDEGSSSTDSTRDSSSTEEPWETLSSTSPFRNSENSDGFTNSPSVSSQSSDKVSSGGNNLSSRSSGREVDKVEMLGFGDTFDCYGSPSFLYSDDSKRYRNLTKHRTVESDFIGSNKENSGVLYRRTSGRITQPFY